MALTVKPCWWPDCRTMPSVKVTDMGSGHPTWFSCRDHLPALQKARRKRVLTFQPVSHLTQSDPSVA